MLAEKTVVAEWLRQKGFFTVRPLYAKTNKDLGYVAVSFHNGMVDEVWHVETVCWVSGSPEPKTLINDLMKSKFINRVTKKCVDDEVKELGVQNLEIKKVAVVGEFANREQAQEIAKDENLYLVNFSQVLQETIQGLNSHFYQDPVIRTLQFMKFITPKNPESLVKMLFGENGIVSTKQKKKFVKCVMDSHIIDGELAQTDLESLRPMLERRKIKDAEALASLIEETLLNAKTRQPFIDALKKRKTTKPLVKKETTLQRFFSQ